MTEGEASRSTLHNQGHIATAFFSAEVLWVAIAAIVWYFVSYVSHPAMPGNVVNYWMGWFGWYDQGKYLESAKALSDLSLTPDTYFYPLGYPLLGAFFVRFLPRHAFLVPNLLCTVFIVLTFYGSCACFHMLASLPLFILSSNSN